MKKNNTANNVRAATATKDGKNKTTNGDSKEEDKEKDKEEEPPEEEKKFEASNHMEGDLVDLLGIK